MSLNIDLASEPAIRAISAFIFLEKNFFFIFEKKFSDSILIIGKFNLFLLKKFFIFKNNLIEKEALK